MDNELQQQWFDKWEAVVNQQEREAFEVFLQDKCCPEGVREELAREPLLLYLLAAMHRDREFTIADFAGKNAIQEKIALYEKSLDWVLTKQRPQWLTEELTEQNETGLQRILAEAGLAVVQAGREYAPISMIEKRLQNDDNAKKLLEAAQQRLGDKPLRNALTSFYLRPGSKEGAVEFVHKSFGEFLCAQRLKESLEEWSLKGIRGQEFYISQMQMDWQLYDLLGATNLTPEIVKYLMALLQASPEFAEAENIVRLFKRLEGFYFRWCKGEFIDASPEENNPQKKMRLLREQLKDRDNFLGLRQVDIYTGLNVLILLFELSQIGRSREDVKDIVNFHPCGQPNTDEWDESQLLKVMDYSECLGQGSFARIVGCFLSGVNLSEADLGGAKLIGTDFIIANLNGAALVGAWLMGARLIGASLNETDLIGANLWKANFTSADLIRADLSDTNLNGADLTSADLTQANLDGAYLGSADLNNILWDENTNWDNVRGLETAKNVPEALKKQLGIG